MSHNHYGIVEYVSTLSLDENMETNTSRIRWFHQLVLVFVTVPYAISNSNSTAICNLLSFMERDQDMDTNLPDLLKSHDSNIDIYRELA